MSTNKRTTLVIWFKEHNFAICWGLSVLLLATIIGFGFFVDLVESKADSDLMRKGAEAVCHLQPIYPQGLWALDNPIAPRQNNRWGLPIYSALKCPTDTFWHIVEALLFIALMTSLIGGMWVFKRALELLHIDTKLYWNYAMLLMVNTIGLGAVVYLNIDMLLIFMVYVIWIALATKRWWAVGLIMTFFAITKPQFLVVPIALIGLIILYYCVQLIRGQAQTELLTKLKALAIILAVAVTAYVLVNLWAAYNTGSMEYGLAQIKDQYRFLSLSNILKNMPFYGPESPKGTEQNGIIQNTIHWLSYWGMTNFIFGWSISTWMVVLWAGSVVGICLWVGIYAALHKIDITIVFIFSILAWLSVMMILPQLEYVNLVAVLPVAFMLLPDMPKGLRRMRYLIYLYIFSALLYFVGIDIAEGAPLVSFTCMAGIVMCITYIIWRVHWLENPANTQAAEGFSLANF